MTDPIPPTCNGECPADEPHRAPCPLAMAAVLPFPPPLARPQDDVEWRAIRDEMIAAGLRPTSFEISEEQRRRKLSTVTEIEWLRPEVDATPRDAVGTPQVQHTTLAGRGKVARLRGGKHGR